MKTAIMKALLFISAITIATLLIGTGPLQAKDKPINLLFGDFDSKKGPFANVKANFAKELEERTGGRVKVQINWLWGGRVNFMSSRKKALLISVGTPRH